MKHKVTTKTFQACPSVLTKRSYPFLTQVIPFTWQKGCQFNTKYLLLKGVFGIKPHFIAILKDATLGNGLKQNVTFWTVLWMFIFVTLYCWCFLDSCCNLDVNAAVLRQYRTKDQQGLEVFQHNFHDVKWDSACMKD